MSFFSDFAHPREWLLRKFMNDGLKGIAEGQYGNGPKRLYWWMHDHATTVGVSLGIADYALTKLAAEGLCPQCASVDHLLISVALFLGSAGLCVGFHAAEPPIVGAESVTYRVIR